MKKYLALAVLLGAIAVTSVSYLAKAEPKTETVTTTVDTTATTSTTPAPAATTAAPVPTAAAGLPAGGNPIAINGIIDAEEANKIAKDTAECATVVSAPKDGVVPTDAEKDVALAECLKSRGHDVTVPQPAPVMEKK